MPLINSDYNAFLILSVVCGGLIIVISLCYIHILRSQIQQKSRALTKQAQTNPQTSLYNRTKIESVIADELRRYQRYQRVFSVILLNIDPLTPPNHSDKQAGDEVLLSLASLLTVNIRATDNIGHLNSETFIIVCPETTQQQAMKLAENLQKAVASCQNPQNKPCSSNVGVTQVMSDDNCHTLLLRAENTLALSKDKKNSRAKSAPTMS
ncbi:hypothetical protein DI392_14615 [Vibrio albus]|uniref:diguanylate cyclase n=1 Tax=Vibrio albus TaxID=2200953 RepID=A0A2U3B7F5_9VIBR|nr:GGDEF domain-containing protein [Vibrio albus]PWI32645.1 hypothetical protein DI392_14615 [Vibrio albus]